ncbi:Na/Pi cotransporter family protein [Cohaesibacter gelatinilyticus]|uniref:Phosphate:Na+ symporter n=1 Tax=Cohaesibacter gelatinilyticus TaxID=372072 RepID=A0A285ND69_9HYPH|nr:Na/Pi cotransporter family protein [Cohaesibacter gelatinilyticus]SNZ07238.1 phosphate:Na+ symporter [Cohaesibacter gelatinilyticus]
MAILEFLINLAGATMLLLFAVRMVRTGIERSYGASFQRLLTRHKKPVKAATAGLGLAVVLQSSAAVALLVSGFAASSLVGFGSGLAAVLGADLGSALVIQILSFKLDWLIPLLLAIGGYLFVKVEDTRPRQIGRILMGVAFILLSLELLRAAMMPIRDSSFLPAIAGYLAKDYLTAFFVGSALAFVMHSSVATILMCVTLVSIDALPLAAGVSLVLGANLGSAFIPIWLSRGMGTPGRRILYSNLLLRGSWALVALGLINNLPVFDYLPQVSAGQMLVNVHLAFNLILLLSLVFVRALEPAMVRFLPERDTQSQSQDLGLVHSALDQAVLGTPSLAFASLKREVLRMSDVVDRMVRPVMDQYEHGDLDKIDALIELDNHVNQSLSDIRTYVAAIPQDEMSKKHKKQIHNLMDYAIALETAGDIVAKRLLPLAEQKAKAKLEFSNQGWKELVCLHEKVLANMALASNVLISNDMESARLLVAEKGDVKRYERKSRKQHLKRLSEGATQSFDSSDIHLETLRALQDFNSQISTVAYPILYQKGQLLETRLIENLKENAKHLEDDNSHKDALGGTA